MKSPSSIPLIAPPPVPSRSGLARSLGALVLLVLSACVAQAGGRQELAASSSAWTLGARPVRQVMTLLPEAAVRLTSALDRSRPDDPGAVALRFEGIRVDRTPGLYYEVYLDLPEGVPAPGVESPHYAGNLSLFGLAQGRHDEEGSEDLPLAATVRKLRQRGLWRDAELTLTFVPQGPPGVGVRIARVALTVD